MIKDIARVQFGYANRFGAITANGKGETVLGQIMMLKNANSKKVIREVKNSVAEIQNNLPEGVFINPVLERGELISKTSFTVVENLILGAIIVLINSYPVTGKYTICSCYSINDSPGIVFHHFNDVYFWNRRQPDESWCSRLWNYH